MNYKLDFGRLVHFTGRNGFFKQSGLCIYYPSVTATLGEKYECVLTPITSKGREGNCSISIPSENLPDVVDYLSSLCRVAAVPKRKYFLVHVEERNGEKEYTVPYLTSVSTRSKKSAEQIADDVARGWYDDRDKPSQMEEWHTFESCQVAARVQKVQQISESDYITLSKYL